MLAIFEFVLDMDIVRFVFDNFIQLAILFVFGFIGVAIQIEVNTKKKRY